MGGVRVRSSSVLRADLMGCPWALKMGVVDIVPAGLVPHCGGVVSALLGRATIDGTKMGCIPRLSLALV